jgi:hypothetical protein
MLQSSHAPRRTNRGSISGTVLGILIFLCGVALLSFTFKLAYDMFQVPPQEALGIKPKQALDLAQAGQSFVGQILRVLLLIVMGLTGSLIANRGISLFAGSRIAPIQKSAPTQPAD